MTRYRISVYAEVESDDTRSAYAAIAETFRQAATGEEPGLNAPAAVRQFKLRQNMTEADALAEWGNDDLPAVRQSRAPGHCGAS